MSIFCRKALWFSAPDGKGFELRIRTLGDRAYLSIPQWRRIVAADAVANLRFGVRFIVPPQEEVAPNIAHPAQMHAWQGMIWAVSGGPSYQAVQDAFPCGCESCRQF